MHFRLDLSWMLTLWIVFRLLPSIWLPNGQNINGWEIRWHKLWLAGLIFWSITLALLIMVRPVFWSKLFDTLITPDRRQSKIVIQSRNVDKKAIETEFLIAICRPTGDKWQSKTLFLTISLAIFYPHSSIVSPFQVCWWYSWKVNFEKNQQMTK